MGGELIKVCHHGMSQPPQTSRVSQQIPDASFFRKRGVLSNSIICFDQKKLYSALIGPFVAFFWSFLIPFKSIINTSWRKITPFFFWGNFYQLCVRGEGGGGDSPDPYTQTPLGIWRAPFVILNHYSLCKGSPFLKCVGFIWALLK